MDKFLGALVALLIVGGALTGMIRSWRRREQRDANITVAHELVDAPSLWTGRVQYVASTLADEPLNRLAIPGLAYRGFATLNITRSGVLITVTGEHPVAVPAEHITNVQPASWTIDRGVGTDGLIRLSWTSAGEHQTAIDSMFRISDPTDRDDAFAALQTLIPATLSSSERS